MSTVANSANRFFWLCVLSFFFPYLAVGIEFGFEDKFCLNLLLTMFVPFGGFIHAIYSLSKARYSRAPSADANVQNSASGHAPNNGNWDSEHQAGRVQQFYPAPPAPQFAASSTATQGVNEETKSQRPNPTVSNSQGAGPLNTAPNTNLAPVPTNSEPPAYTESTGPSQVNSVQ